MMPGSTGRMPVLCMGEVPDFLILELAGQFELLFGDADDLITRRGIEIRAVIRRTGKIDQALFERMPSLELVANFGAGYDQVDAPSALHRGIAVSNTPGVLDDEVADVTIGMLLATLRQIPQAMNHLLEGKWQRGHYPLTPSLRGRSVGLIGMGRIGQKIARRLDGFGIPIFYHSRSPQPSIALRHYPELLAMAEAVNTLIAIVPGGPETQHLINARILDALGPSGVVINMSRGSVLDEKALIEALNAGRILAAGLDVFQNEPTPDPALLRLPNSVVTPHIGSGTEFTRKLMWQLLGDNLRAWFEDKDLPSAIPGSISQRQPASC